MGHNGILCDLVEYCGCLFWAVSLFVSILGRGLNFWDNLI